MLKTLIWSLLGLLLLNDIGIAQTCASYPYTFSNGTTADASQVMSNFNTVRNCANTLASGGTLTNTTLAGTTNATGNIGIGTTAPSDKLQIDSGDIRLTLGQFLKWNPTSAGIGSDANELRFYSGNSLTTPKIVLDASGNVGIGTSTISDRLQVDSGDIRLTLGQFLKWNPTSAGIGSNANELRFYSGNSLTTTKMVLDANGNVGIGATSTNLSAGSTGKYLTLAGQGTGIYDDGRLELANLKTTAASGDEAGVLLFVNKNNSGDNRSAQIYSMLRGSGGTNGFGSDITITTKKDNSTSVNVLSMDQSGTVTVGKTDVGGMTVNNGGSTNFGATAGSGLNIAQLTGVPVVNAVAQITLGPANNVYGQTAIASIQTNTASYGYSDLLFGTRNVTTDTAPTERMRITSAGLVGIGTASPGYTLHVNGSVAGTSAYNNLSDGRLKKDIVPIQNALDTIEQLRGMRFKWRAPEERIIGTSAILPLGESRVGFVAQEVQKVLPEAVTVSAGDGLMSIAESSIVSVLVEAMKELKAANDKQAAAIAELQRQVDELQQKIGVTATR